MASIAPFGFEISELTSEWLTSLSRHLKWVEESESVTSFEITKLDEIGYKTVVYAVELHYSKANEGAPSSIVVKLAKLIEGVANQHIIKYFKQEYNWYEFHKDRECTFRIPKYHYGFYQEDGKFILILENLLFRTGKIGNQTKGIDLFYVKEILKDIAKHHAQWWESPLLDEIQWIKGARTAFESYCPFFTSAWPSFVQNFPDKLQNVSENLKEVGEYFSEELKKYDDHKYFRGKKTLLHGDLRGGNIIFWDKGDSEIFCALDFQCIHAGNCAEDVAYFIGGSVTTEDFDNHEKELLDIYYNELIANGVKNFSFDEFLDDYKHHLILNFLTPIISVQKRSLNLKSQPGAPFPTPVDYFIASWMERVVHSVDQRVPNAVEYLKSRWSHVNHSDSS